MDFKKHFKQEKKRRGRRTVTDRKAPLCFGKHKELSLKQIAKTDPTYILWLQKNDVIYIKKKKDRKWFVKKAWQIDIERNYGPHPDQCYFDHAELMGYMGDIY